MLRRRIAACGVAVAMITAAACTNGDDDTAPPTTPAPTTTTIPEREHDGILTIGVFLPLTGPGAAIGPPMIQAIRDAVADINGAGGVLGADIEIVPLDEGSGSITELLDADVDAIIGPASSTVALSSLRPVVDPNSGVVVCSPMATALALDDYPANGFFFRTAPSDSLQMGAIGRQAERTGTQSVAIGYLDDPYGRGLRRELEADLNERSPRVVSAVGFDADQDDLSAVAAELLAEEPGVVVVLGDSNDGPRLLAALDNAADEAPQVIINDSIRQARATIRNLSAVFRARLSGVAPMSTAVDGAPRGFFVAHAVDCVNLIVLAAMAAGSDDPRRIAANMRNVSRGGQVCDSFDDCAEFLAEGLLINYNGLSGRVDLSNTTGAPEGAWFESFRFNQDGNESAERETFEFPA